MLTLLLLALPTLTITRAPSPPTIDGRLDEPIWRGAATITRFTQRTPDPGAPVSERTRAWILYDDEAIYVGVRAEDRHPISARLCRHDTYTLTDWIAVSLGSRGDRRTAYTFAVSAAGVRRDQMRFDDAQVDARWGAVWEGAAHRAAWGYSVELRIPLSQLRFEGGGGAWDLQLSREIARRGEVALWAPIPLDARGWVSRYGRMEGLEGVEPPDAVAFWPYLRGRARLSEPEPGDPFDDGARLDAAGGFDLKRSLGGDLTLDATINPDFGQVEMDPAQLNLSAFEIFLPEQRPFFLEEADLFSFNGLDLFYSRRVGRAPQGSADARGGHVDAPDESRILGAGRISGRSGAWSFGALTALTEEVEARVAPAEGARVEEVIEPAAIYSVARARRSWRGGASTLGGMLTSTYRLGDDVAWLRREAYTGGIDGQRQFWGRRWSLDGHAAFSHVRGSREALQSTQESSARYAQRPDNTHARLDPTRGALSGGAAALNLGKTGGGPWRGGVNLYTRSPGFEINDVGYLSRVDAHGAKGWIQLRDDTPGLLLLDGRVQLDAIEERTYGDERTRRGLNLNASGRLKSQWGGWIGASWSDSKICVDCTWGGPSIIAPPSTSVWGGLHSDARAWLHVELGGWRWVQLESDTQGYGFNAVITARPHPALSLKIEPLFERLTDSWMWVGQHEDQYVFGRLRFELLQAKLRLDWILNPDLSLQLFAQPLLSAGRYDRPRAVADGRAAAWADRWRALDLTGRAEGQLSFDEGAWALDEPDFNDTQLRLNLILRWAWRPGSTLFFVWQQTRGRDTHTPGERQRLGRDLRRLLSDEATVNDTLMVKLSYYLSR